MAFLDVSDILTDPDFVDKLQVERNAQSVSAAGLGSVTPAISPFYGVVTNASGEAMTRNAEGERVGGTIIIHTKFRLIAGDEVNVADVVQWQGRRYTVKAVDPYVNFGQGFSAATCDLIPLSG